MIQKEQIQKRRQEIAEIRHADSVFRDIVARENEREDYEKRWFWELLQNAKDSIDDHEKIHVKIEISENQISFSHTGHPFELDDILSLIIQGSSKNNKKGKTGRFGTGFMTTYLLSKEVTITGKLANNQGCFHFLLDRNATDHDDFYRLQKISNQQFDESIREESYLGNDIFQTNFTYKLSEKGKLTAKIGLQCLDELIPITQLFNDQIESVTVVEDGQIKSFSKVKLSSTGTSIDEWEVTTLVNDHVTSQLKAYIYKNETSDVCVVTQKHKGIEKIFQLNSNYPRLYYTFPLIGTEEIGIPVIINSTEFDPKVERDGIYLKQGSEGGNEIKNKKIVSDALLNSLEAFAELFTIKNVSGIYELFNFKVAKDLKWIDGEWLTSTKSKSINELSSKKIIKYDGSPNDFTTLYDLTIPYSDVEDNNTELWNLLSAINTIKIPTSSELLKWIEISRNINQIAYPTETIYSLKYICGINGIIQFVEDKENLQTLQNHLKTDSIDWLNNFYRLVNILKNYFPLDRKICLNQTNKFRSAESMEWDECKDDTLISISEDINLKFGNKLFSRLINKFQISGVEDFSLQAAINKIKFTCNALTESDFIQTSNKHGNARFLKWLIAEDKIEEIRDLKIMTGASQRIDENPLFQHFRLSEHLLLAPKSFFEETFPLYSNLVRDKDCLNEVYNEFLDEFDYEFLDKNKFIHKSPLVTKTENASIKLLEHLLVNEEDLNLLRDEEGLLKNKFEITYSDFAYLTAADGFIYARNTTQKSSYERLKFLLTEAVEKDIFFDSDIQEVNIEGIDFPISFRKCRWVYRAKRLNWVNIKTEGETTETKFVSETPSSKNLSELIKSDEALVKTIRGSRQQSFLNKLGVGVSDLIRNTLANDELKLSWDMAITNMITSDANPELVQEIFNDPNVRKEYEKRLNERKLIARNQTIGKLIEDLFTEYIESLRESGATINIKREPFGSDYIISEESSDFVNSKNEREAFKINNWLIELKATKMTHASMTPLQAKTATEQKEKYSLVVVPLSDSEPDIEYLRRNAKVITNIGHRIETVFRDFTDVENKKDILSDGQNGISVNIEDQNIRFKVSSDIWLSEPTNIELFIRNNFANN
jgi:hypothetical protein